PPRRGDKDCHASPAERRKACEAMLAVVTHRAEVAITADEEGDLREAAVQPRPVSPADGLVRPDRLPPLDLERPSHTRLVPRIARLAVGVGRPRPFDPVEVDPPRPSADVVTPRVCAEVEPKIAVALVPLWLVQVEDVV